MKKSLRRIIRSGCFVVAFFIDTTSFSQSVIDSHIKTDQIGYRTGAKKIALISNPQVGYNAPSPYTPGTTLEVRTVAANTLVFSGTPVAWNGGATHGQSGDKVWWFDFSTVTAVGDYYINDPTNNKRSYAFRIADDVYNDALKYALRSFYYQRCGTPKAQPYAGNNYTDVTCHEGNLQDLDCRDVINPSNTSLSKDLSGGWHDAGDYNKYVNFTLSALHYLLDAYEQRPAVFGDNSNIPESGNGTPDILDETKWELDWLLKMQLSDGSVLMKVSTLGFTGGSPPSTDNAQRLYGAAQSSSTRTVASVFAHAAIIFRAQSSAAMQIYGDTLLARAQLAWTWLQNNPGYSNYTNTNFSSANPEVSHYDQDGISFSAAVYLFAATGNTSYRTYVDNNYLNVHALQWTYWYPFESVYQNAMLYYCTTFGATPSVVNTIEGNCITSVNTNNADLLPAYNNNTDAYMAYMKDQDYQFNNNEFKAETGALYTNMNRYNLDPLNQINYKNAGEGYVHYFHGMNPNGNCFLSNAGIFGADKFTLQIYHGWFGDGTMYDSSANYIGPPPGYLVCGDDYFYTPDAAYSGPPISPPMNQPVQKCYKDWNTSWPENSWQISEVGIYTEAAYIKLLSMYADSFSITTSSQIFSAVENNWFVFPNPSSNFITISGKQNEKVSVELYDMTGNLVLQKESFGGENISVEELSPAIYFCIIRDEKEIIATEKISIIR
jgi:endoglucanase